MIDERPFDPDSEEDHQRLGEVYTELLTDTDFLHVLMHGFAAGSVPEIGRVGRDGLARIYATIKRTGCTDDEVREFLSYGMLLNVLVSMHAFEPANSVGPLGELVNVCLPDPDSAKMRHLRP